MSQRTTTGKPSTQLNLDTASATIRLDLLPPEEIHNTEDRELQGTNTAANKTKDPNSPFVEVSNKLDTGVPDVMGRHNPSPMYSNINGKEYIIVLGTTKTHRHMTPDRHDPEPPDTP